MKKRIRLNESELTGLIKSVVETKRKQQISEQALNPEAMETADAIYTIIGTTIGLLGIAGYDILKQYAKELMSAGKKKEARKMMSAIKDMESEGEDEINSSELGEGVYCVPPKVRCGTGCCSLWEIITGKRSSRSMNETSPSELDEKYGCPGSHERCIYDGLCKPTWACTDPNKDRRNR